jgi:hypothetical protein
MELETLETLIGDYSNLQAEIIKEKPTVSTADYIKQYDPKQHDVADATKRPDKLITTDAGPSTVSVARIPISLQKTIVRVAAAFLCGNPIKLSAKAGDEVGKNLLIVLQKTWDDNKLDYMSKDLLKKMMSETECAELWYTEPADPLYWANTPIQGAKFRLRIKKLAPSLGDKLYPTYNAAGDMIAFGRGYSIKVGDKNEDHFDLYLSDRTFKGVKLAGGWEVTNEPNPALKIPVVYYTQDLPEWSDVQEMIDRMEKVISNHADTNDYFGSPTVVVDGEVEGFAKKGEQGKVLKTSNGGKVAYLTWDQSPESVKLEYSNLRSLIFDMTNTPDISIENMKALGVFSGIALKLLFMGAHMKAAEKEEIFGEGIQRRINFLKAALAKISVSLEKGLPLSIKPKFEYYLPKNDQEIINNLSSATGAKPTMSQATAVSQNPYVSDADAELEAMKTEGLDTEMNQ